MSTNQPNPAEVKVVVDGKSEQWNPGGKQSDGSEWFIPKPLVPSGHKHFFNYDSGKRWAECECGFGGYVFPHNAYISEGHIYRKKDKKFII